VRHDLSGLLFGAAEKVPDAVAQVDGGRRQTYAELTSRSLSLAARLEGLGVGRGDLVLLMLPNVAAFTEAYFGIAAAGAVSVPLNVALTPSEAGPLAARSGARFLITGDGASVEAVEAVRAAGATTILYSGERRPAHAEDFEEAAAGTARPRSWVEAAPDATAVVFFTSGTTGAPKGVELSHANLVTNARWVAESSLSRRPGEKAIWGPGHVALARLPLSHSFGQTTMQNAPLVHGGAVSYAQGPFGAEATLAQMARDRVTVAAMVPTMAAALADCPAVDRLDLSAFQYALVGGAPIPAELFPRFEQRLGAEIVEGYGLTETSPVCAFRTPFTPRRAGSVGRAAAGAALAAVDEAGCLLPAGSVGELVVKGAPVMKGFFGSPAATGAAIRNGWLRTGDVGIVDADGYVYVVDRKSDTIIRNGYTVYPAEVEQVLREHPSVADAAVVGLEDERVGEEVVAFVVPADGCCPSPGSLSAFCLTRLAAYKYPRRFVTVPDLPRGAKGQLLRAVLRGRCREAMTSRPAA
jgi:long-chain acyl-CoA synthetase